MREKRNINSVYVFYRISDNGFKSKMKLEREQYVWKNYEINKGIYFYQK